jgi:hypothetical protein
MEQVSTSHLQLAYTAVFQSKYSSDFSLQSTALTLTLSRAAGEGNEQMNLFTKLQQRAADNKPIRIGLIGAGKFGSMSVSPI